MAAAAAAAIEAAAAAQAKREAEQRLEMRLSIARAVLTEQPNISEMELARRLSVLPGTASNQDLSESSAAVGPGRPLSQSNVFTDHLGHSFTPKFRLRQRDEQFLREVMSRSDEELFVITDPSLPDNPMVYISPSFEDFTGYESESVLGTNCRFLQGKNTNPRDVRKIRNAIARRTDITLRLTNYTKDGVEFTNQFFLTTLRRAGTGDGRMRIMLRPWVKKLADKIRARAAGAAVPLEDRGGEPGPPVKSSLRRKGQRRGRSDDHDIYFIGVLCECDTADRSVILNFGANFRRTQPPDEETDSETESLLDDLQAVRDAGGALESGSSALHLQSADSMAMPDGLHEPEDEPETDRSL